MTTSSASLPGVVFETDAPVPSGVLPRMDIAGFVGYASRGPLHTPVAIESVARLRDVFGPDLGLAWDDAQGVTLTSHLARAVEQFFESGGRRCWVVRVADLESAEANGFPVPGLVGADGTPTRAQARAAGSWSDDLRVGTVADRRIVGIGSFDDEGAGTLGLVRPMVDVREGDLLELSAGDTRVRFATVRRADLEAPDGPRVRVALTQHDWFHRDRDLGRGTGSAFFVRAGDGLQIDIPDGEFEPPAFVYVADAGLARPSIGDELRLALADSGDGVVMAVDDVEVGPPDEAGRVRVTLTGDPGWRASARVLFADPTLEDGAYAASFVRSGGASRAELPDGVVRSGEFVCEIADDAGRPSPGDELHLTRIDDGNGGVVEVHGVFTESGDAPGTTRLSVTGRSLSHTSARVSCLVRSGREGGLWVDAELPATSSRPGFGDVVHVTLVGSESVAWMTVADVETGPVAFGGGGSVGVRAFGPETLWPIEGSAFDGADVRVTRVGFELQVWSELQLLQRMVDLGCSASGAEVLPSQSRESALATTDTFEVGADVPSRFWGRLPIDEHAFQLEEERVALPDPGTVESDAHEPRFSLAGPVSQGAVYLPLGMAHAPSALATVGAATGSGRGRLEREGVEHHHWRRFVDERFVSTKAAALGPRVRSEIYEADAQPLRGLHAFWPLSEVTIAAIPDAVHPGWSLASTDTGEVRRLVAPEEIAAELHPSWVTVSWSEVAGDRVTYQLEESADPAFRVSGIVASETTPRALLALGSCAQRYFRVRAIVDGVTGPWSRTVSVERPVVFDACASISVDPAEILLRSDPLALVWPEIEEATAYTIEASADPAFGLVSARVGPVDVGALGQGLDEFGQPVMIAPLDEVDPDGPLADLAADVLSADVRYFRVRAWRDEVGSMWSNTVGWADVGDVRWRADVRAPGALHEASVGAQRALLRLCAARGDVFGVLTAPVDHDTEEIRWHASALRSVHADVGGVSGIPALSADEHLALTHGALYHPWVATRQSGVGRTTLRPVDGLFAGLLARLAIDVGPWRAPANASLPGALALFPDVERATRLDQLRARVNVVRDEPSGFMALSAVTLSDIAELEQIGSRRLMSLLRRVAQREGDRLAFESNTEETREQVFFAFTALLEGMFRRGAFSGASPSEAFQVVVDESVNTPASVDRGRLLVELKVAPATPLRFMTVRLVQVDGQVVAVEEA